jgi:hypothetical protein
MPITMSPDAQQRALRALAYMIKDGFGIMRAAELAGSSRRSIHKYMKMIGIKYKITKGKMRIVKTLEQRMHEFINHMARGDSATSAAKKAHTQVKTMAKQRVNGYPIIKKVDRKWILNAYPLYNHSMVLYGHIVGMDGNIQGAHEEGDGEIKSPDAPDIWWQIDFNEFISTLPDYEVGEFWKDDIVEWLRNELELPLVVNDTLADRFLGNEEVFDNATEEDRIDVDGKMKITKLENLLSRYDVKLYDYVNYGIDDNHPHRPIEYISKEEMGERSAIGLFQIFFVKDEPLTYPQEGPMELEFEYNLNDERD